MVKAGADARVGKAPAAEGREHSRARMACARKRIAGAGAANPRGSKGNARAKGSSARGSGKIRPRMAREGWMPSARRCASLPSGASGIQNQDRRRGR